MHINLHPYSMTFCFWLNVRHMCSLSPSHQDQFNNACIKQQYAGHLFGLCPGSTGKEKKLPSSWENFYNSLSKSSDKGSDVSKSPSHPKVDLKSVRTNPSDAASGETDVIEENTNSSKCSQNVGTGQKQIEKLPDLADVETGTSQTPKDTSLKATENSTSSKPPNFQDSVSSKVEDGSSMSNSKENDSGFHTDSKKSIIHGQSKDDTVHSNVVTTNGARSIDMETRTIFGQSKVYNGPAIVDCHTNIDLKSKKLFHEQTKYTNGQIKANNGQAKALSNPSRHWAARRHPLNKEGHYNGHIEKQKK